MKNTMIGIDIAKRKMYLVGQDETGKTLFKKSCQSKDLINFMNNQDRCLVGIEACGGSSYWARKLKSLGFEVRLVNPLRVSKMRIRQKNDYNDCESIIELLRRVDTKFIGVNETWQQDIQTLHRIRTSRVRRRVELTNQIHGFALEYGIFLPEGVSKFKAELLKELENGENELTEIARKELLSLYEEILLLRKKEYEIELKLREISSKNQDCQKLLKVPGVGVMTATAFLAAVGDPTNFKNGREVSAWLGLVPRQNTTGGKVRLGRISKRGDSYVRQLLVHGGRALMVAQKRLQNKGALFDKIARIELERGNMKAAVAIANRNARVMFAMLKNQVEYVA